MRDLKNILSKINSGAKIPALKLVSGNPELAAVIAKLIPSREAPLIDNGGNRKIADPDPNAVRHISENTARSQIDAMTIQEVLPDTEIAIQLLISAVLSPKDMVATEVNYTVDDSLLTHEVTGHMLTTVRKFLTTDYKIEPLLSKILRDVLFEKGSHPVVVLPENAIDEIINGPGKISYEAIRDEFSSTGIPSSKGFLGPNRSNEKVKTTKRSLGLEAAFENFSTPYRKLNEDESTIYRDSTNKPLLTVTDNFNVLKLPEIEEYARENAVMERLGRSSALESVRNISDNELSQLVYGRTGQPFKAMTVIKHNDQLSRRTVGNPLILHLPPEAVLPVFVPGSPERQIGFFVLLDGLGRPVSLADNPDYFQQVNSQVNAEASFPSAMLNKINLQMSGTQYNNTLSKDQIYRTYASFVEKDLLERLKSGVMGDDLKIAHKDDIYQIMLHRALQEKQSQLLFVPSELMTYFAFKYNKDGIGISYLEAQKILNSLRAMVRFANVMGSLRNSIGRTEVKLKLDPEDPDPKKSIEIAMSEIIRSRQQYFPLGINSPNDMVDWLQKAGYEFSFEGHPGIPDVGVDFGQKSDNYVKPDTDLEASLKRDTIMGFGIPAEIVDQTFSPEFATSVVSNNLILAKNALNIQDVFVPQLTDHLRKFLINSEKVITALKKIVEDNFETLYKELDIAKEGIALLESTSPETANKKKEFKEVVINSFIHSFLSSFKALLPKPNSATIENQTKALQTYIEGLDLALDAWVSDKFITEDTGGQLSRYVGSFREMIRAYFIRQWLTENGMLPELSALTATDKDNKLSLDLFDLAIRHNNQVNVSMLKGVLKLTELYKKVDTKLEELGAEGSGASSGNDTGNSDGSEGGMDGGFGDEPDFGSDFGTEEEPADDATQSNPEEKTPPGNETEVKETPKEGENTPE